MVYIYHRQKTDELYSFPRISPDMLHNEDTCAGICTTAGSEQGFISLLAVVEAEMQRSRDDEEEVEVAAGRAMACAH